MSRGPAARDSFSGLARSRQSVRWPVLTLVLLASLTFLLGLGRQAITDSDEAFYAEAAREMVEGGDWLTPHFNYEDRWQKPVLYYWLAATAFVVGGATEAMARLGAALSGISLVFLTWAACRRLGGDDDAAWIAGAITATCYGYFAMARSALPDLPLALFITATIWAAMRASDRTEGARAWWSAAAGLSAGLGFLTKGPLGVVIPAIVLLPIWWRERRTLTISAAHVVLAAAVFALVGLPWYVAMTLTHGSAYLQSFFVGDNLERFATTRYNGVRTVWYYVPIVIGGLLPWSAFLLVLPWRTLRDIAKRRRALTDSEWRLVIWTAAPFILFTISIGKQPRYVLPLLPPLAIALGNAIAARVASRESSAERELKIATWSTTAMFVLIGVLVFRARSLFLSAYPSLTWIGLIAALCMAVVLAAAATARAWQRLPAIMAVSGVVLLLTLEFGAFAGKRPEAVEQIAAMIRENRHANETIGEYDTFVRNLVFYTGVPQVPIVNDSDALAFLKSSDRVFLVLNRSDLDRLKMLTDLPLRTLGEVTYLNSASVRVRTFLQPLPGEDLETVAVVTNR